MIKLMKPTLLFVFINTCLALTLNAQYNITVNIENLKDSTIYLGYYFGDKQYAKDTAVLNNKGKAVFTGKDTLPYGLYFILVPGNNMFEVMIDKEQIFSLSTKYTNDAADLTKYLTVKNNKEQELYIGYQKFMTIQNEKAIALRKQLKETADENRQKSIKDSLQILNDQVMARWDDIKQNHPESFLASILYCIQDVEVPDPPKDEKGNITDSLFQYHYYKQHYFDHVNFADARLLRTRFYYDKLDRYFEKMIIPVPDSVIKESKMVLDKASANDEIFQYTLQTLFNKYNNSNVMGMDKAFVFFAENYYLKDKATWADSAWIEKVRKRVKEIKPNLIGNKAPTLHLISNDGSLVSLEMIDADYTILFFFEPSCGHCKKTTPKMKELGDKYWEKGVEIMGIYTQSDKTEWDRFIQEQHLENWINAWDPYNQSGFRANYDVSSTPTIYLLDKNKVIIGKKIDVETIDKMLGDLLKEKK